MSLLSSESYIVSYGRGGQVGSLEWLEGQIAEIIDNPVIGEHTPTLRGKSDTIFEHRWCPEITVWATDFIDLPEFYFDAQVYAWDVGVASLYWRALGSPPDGMRIVSRLVDSEEYQGAIKFSEECGDLELKNHVLEMVAPRMEHLRSRVDILSAQFGCEVIEGIDEYELFKASLSAYDFDSATEHLDLLELIASEFHKGDPESNLPSFERRATLIKWLSLVDVGLDSQAIPDSQLETVWLGVLQAHVSERIHLIAVEKPLDAIDKAPVAFLALIASFKDENQNPDRWLPSKVSSDFSYYVSDAAETLASWAKSAPIYNSEEQRAAYVVCEWFIKFVVERSRSIYQLEETEGLNSAMDRIFEVSAIIENAGRPALCLAQLRETGELPDDLVDASFEENQIKNEGNNSKLFGSKTDGLVDFESSRAEVTLQVVDFIKKELWEDAGVACKKIGLTQGGDASNLSSMGDIFNALADDSPKPADSVVDKFHAAAVWLSASNEFVILLPESKRVDLAFRVLSGVIAADSGDEMTRLVAPNGGWTEILGRSSPFRKMLAAGVTYRVEKVLEALLTGALSIPIAERLWDAATNINDPHTYRTPLLTFLYEHGASEALGRLAAKYDPGIAARLSQLFELRSVASGRPDLVPVAQSVADQVVTAAKSVPFRTFVKELPTAAQIVKPKLDVGCEGDLCLRDSAKSTVFELPVVVTAQGLVPVRLEASLFEGDDAVFDDGTLRMELFNRPMYFAKEFSLRIRFGSSWFAKGSNPRDGVRVRIRAKTVTDDFFVEDVVCRVRAFDSRAYTGASLNTDTLLDIYPGVSNTPAVEEAFIGRHDELECLNQVLVSARRPSPVLLTGMRRIGKTSLLFAFHNRLRQPGNSTAISFYLSLAERRVEFVGHERSVSATIFRAISHGLVRPNLSVTDQNHAMCSRIRQRFDGDWRSARKAIQECFDEESLSDSLIALSDKILEWTGAPTERFILLIDEAESLVAPYQAGGTKKLELEQLLQSLREVSQTTGAIGILLAGSNHINVFAREYKNAFFGSSQLIELAGLKDAKEAAALVAPFRVSAFVQFEMPAIEYAFSLCAGMPQFLWQVGATVAHLVRTGAATKKDVRMAVAALVGERKTELPFKSYEILEPIESMLALESARERDLLWMLLYRIANASSLVAEDATVPFVIDHALSALEERAAWNRRLRSLVDLKILRMDSSSTIRFQVPLFAEGFRAKKYWQEYNIKLQGVAV